LFDARKRGCQIFADTDEVPVYLTHSYNPFLCMTQQIHFIEVATRRWVPIVLLTVVCAKLVVAGRHT
jgi:hypothetical protein